MIYDLKTFCSSHSWTWVEPILCFTLDSMRDVTQIQRLTLGTLLCTPI